MLFVEFIPENLLRYVSKTSSGHCVAEGGEASAKILFNGKMANKTELNPA